MLFPAVFAILVGVSMIGQWSFSYFSKQIPELETERVRVLFHIAAELITALALIAGGIGLLVGQMACRMPFLNQILFSSNRATSAGSRAR
jgi:hypothetical protein